MQIFNCSDCNNAILWQLRPREREALQYNEKLKEKFQHHPQVKRIARHRHVPRSIYTNAKELQIIHASQKRKYVLIVLCFVEENKLVGCVYKCNITISWG
jgi:hypothetical protein